MLQYIINRPVGVIMSFLGLVFLGLVILQILPVSLLPDLPVPQITIQINYPNTAVNELENIVVRPIRNQLLQVNNLRDIQSTTRNSAATITLDLQYNTNINLAFIEANEKIDQIISQLPRDLERPRVIKTNASDIPVFYLSITARDSGIVSPLVLNDLTRSVIKRRIEQLSEVAFVDRSGFAEPEIIIRPFQEKMQALKLSVEDIENELLKNDIDLGSILVKDGHYQYNIRFLSELKTKKDIENIYLPIEGRTLQLKDIAVVTLQEQKRRGAFLFNKKEGIVLSVRKQANAQLFALKKTFGELLKSMEEDYPAVAFQVTNDQSELLEVSISNLRTSLYYGACFAFVILLLFFRSWKAPLLIGIAIPVALIISFLAFYLLNISINVISLSGLILGVGLMVDNAIIVIENIRQQRALGLSSEIACVRGANEVIRPLISSALTTCSVFLPLIFLSGIGGALFYDLAVSVSIALASSLVVAYLLLPVLLNLIDRKTKNKIEVKPGNTSLYSRSVDFALQFRWLIILIFTIFVGVAFFPLQEMDKKAFPALTRNAFLVNIDWNESIDLAENKKRVNRLLTYFEKDFNQATTFLGERQFLLDLGEQSMNEAQIIFYFDTLTVNVQKKITQYLNQMYPYSALQIAPLKNIFDEIFASNRPPLIAHIQSTTNTGVPSVQEMIPVFKALQNQGIDIAAPPEEEQIFIEILKEKTLLYKISYSQIYQKLTTLFNQNTIGNLNTSDQLIPITIGNEEMAMFELLENAMVINEKGNYLPLKLFLNIYKEKNYKYIQSGKAGSALSVALDTYSPANQKKIKNAVRDNSKFTVYFSGQFFENQKLIKELSMVLLIAIIVLYLILAAQFESLLQPFIIILTVPIGMSGAIFSLYLMGQSINVIAIIGIIVMSGIVVNDAILKVDMMNKLLPTKGLIGAIHGAGHRRLKPIIMTSVTTILALLPVLFSLGLGAELQQPLAYAVIGGLLIGTIASLYFIPVLYAFF